ncbi:hypothetical protein FNF29_08202 [Cafeteria roenbergensis]|uniref:Anaphase-promoting complex subunit 5 n=1 Tax=Cafeteria roenbergensis TaxID=33653 RepID=A0A5A8C0F3_CAFRO|nr:hypothetical protein FNF29_08202 [Cafeteria roenbergensis]|eukprot:KAA0146185.1 hypothetical protein FNF29_08202 [Cafeteria roenbergensis]
MAPAGRAALLSMELLVASVAATDGRALALLTLISMFPAGLSHTDLDIIWGAHGPVFASAPADAVQEMADRNADALRAAGIPVGGRGTAGHGITDKDELTATEGQRSDGDDDLEGGTDAGFSGADSNATAWEDGASACDAADRMSLNSYCRPGAAFASGLSPPPLPHHRHRSVRARRPTPSMGGSHTGQPGGSSAMHGSVVASLDGGTAISSLMDTSWGRFPANASAVAGSAASLDATSVAISARWAVTREGVFASVLGRTAARKDWSGRLRALVDASAVRRRTVSGRSPLAAALDCWALWVVGSEAVEESLTRLKLLPYNTTPPSLPLMWLLASRADVASLSDGLPYLEAGTLDAFAGATGLPPAPGRSTAEAAGSALPSGPAYGHGHGHLPPTAAYVSLRLDRQTSARQLARCLAAAQLNPACIPSAYPRTRALRLELLLRACVHFHASAEFVQACLAVDTAASRRHAATLTRATVHHVLCVLDMAAALTELCVTAEDQRAALLRRTGNGAKGGAPADSEAAADGPAPLGSSSGARAERHLPMLDERFIACCREGLHHAALAGATLSSAMLELGMDPGQALDVATASLRLFGVRVDWHPEAALELRRGRHRSVWRVADVLRLNLALACSRKAAGLALAATGQVARARQQLMGARMLFNAAHSGSRHAAAAASVLVAMGLHSSDQGDVRMARRCLAEALDTYRVGFDCDCCGYGGSGRNWS